MCCLFPSSLSELPTGCVVCFLFSPLELPTGNFSVCVSQNEGDEEFVLEQEDEQVCCLFSLLSP